MARATPQRRSAHTLLEAMVALGLTLFVASLGITSWLTMNRAARTEQTRIDARLQLRTAVGLLRSQLQSAGWIYAGYQGSFAGHVYRVPDGHTPAPPGQADLIFALPEANRINAVTLWKIVGLSVEPTGHPDPNNPGALDLVLRTVDNVQVGTPAGLASGGRLASLSTQANTTTTRFAAYVDPSDCLADVRLQPFSAVLKFTFKVRPTDVSWKPGYYQTEHYATEVYLRNQPAVTE